MASYYTSNTLIESVKRRETIPTSQVTFEDPDFLAFANEEIALGMLPTIMQYHEEYLVYSDAIDLVANQSSYAIPYRAVGNKIRHLYIQDGDQKRELARIHREDEMYYTNGSVNSNVCSYFFLENNMIILVPGVGSSATGQLVVSYYMRPNQLVVEDRVAIISVIDRDTGVITIDGLPTGLSSATPIDFIEARGGHRTKGKDISPTAAGSMSVTFDPLDIPADLVVGDHINFAGETIIPQIPDDLHVMLAQRVATRILEALGDINGLAAAQSKLADMEAKTGMLIDNRTEGTPQKAVNWRGPLSRRRTY